jgi:DNA-binding NtrC family response regulator
MSEGPERRDVLLVAANLNERRLLYGELLEAGYDVLPVSGVALALGKLLQKSIEPRLVLIDAREDPEALPASVEYLGTLIPDVPLIVVISSVDRAIWQPVRSRDTMLLPRPITIGQIVAAVKQALPPDQLHRSTN